MPGIQREDRGGKCHQTEGREGKFKDNFPEKVMLDKNLT